MTKQEALAVIESIESMSQYVFLSGYVLDNRARKSCFVKAGGKP